MKLARGLMVVFLSCNILVADPCLFEEIEHESQSGVISALQEGASIKEQDERDDTPLMRAVDENKKIAFIRFLLEQGFSVNTPNSHGVTPIMTAAKNGNADLVLFLTTVHANVNQKDIDGMTPLMWLARAWPIVLHKEGLGYPQEGKNYPQTLHFLISSGANINEQDHKGRTPMMHALENIVTWCPDAAGEARVLVTTFMKAGIRLDIQDKKHKKACDYAKNLAGIESILCH